MTAIDPDLYGAASHRNLVEHLTAPLGAGAVTSPVAIDNAGRASVDWAARYPLLLVAPTAPVDMQPLSVVATIPAPGGGTEAVTLVFAPYTEAGAFLVVYAPHPDDEPAPFGIELALTDGSAAVPDPQIASRVRLELLEGVLGRTLYALGAEKSRLRRHGREGAAMRLLARARDSALDRIGVELAVPRFADALLFSSGDITSKVEREADDDYRRRLALYRRLFLRTEREALELLNGPGAALDANAGAIGQLAQSLPAASRPAYQKRFAIVDKDNEFAVGIKLVAAGDPAFKDNFLEFIRSVYLIWPGTTAAANTAHSTRFLPAVKRDRESAMRADLRALFDFGTFAAGPEPALAPLLAAAMIRAARCIRALAGPSPWPIFRAQHGDGGSRYELGLGVDAKRLTSAELNAMRTRHAALKAADPGFGQVADPETRGLLSAMEPVSAAADPDGLWLLEPCGLRTIHRIRKPTGGPPFDLTFLSHFPIFGLTVSELPPKPAIAVGGWTLATSGSFAARQNERVFAYQRDLGVAQVWSANGGLSKTFEQTGWPKTLTHVVHGNFTESPEEELFLYDPSAGAGRLALIDAKGQLRGAGTVPALGKTWTHVAAGLFSRSATDIVFYDRAAGVVARYRPDGKGGLALQKQTAGFRRTWSHLDQREAPGAGRLFCYDDRAGEAAFFRLDNAGRFVQDGPTHHRPPAARATHVVPALSRRRRQAPLGVLLLRPPLRGGHAFDDGVS